MPPATEKNVGFIGFGMMGQSLAKGIMSSGALSKGKLWASDPLIKFESIDWIKEYDVKTTRQNEDIIKNCSVLFLAVKPCGVSDFIEEIRAVGLDLSEVICISMVAGWDTLRLTNTLGSKHIVRIMPNICAAVCQSAIAICGSPDTPHEDLVLTKNLLAGCGGSWILSEKLVSLWTVGPGAGPAAVFLFMEALADAYVAGGLPRETAQAAAAQTVYGSAKMALEQGKHFCALKDSVCSPGGVTIAGIQSLKESGFEGTVMKSVSSALRRLEELRN